MRTLEWIAGAFLQITGYTPDDLIAAGGWARLVLRADIPAVRRHTRQLLANRESVAEFRIVPCETCGGVLKPDVVFFGGTVGEPTMTAAWSLFSEGEVLLVVGSSLTVYSGFRFARRAHELGIPVALVNDGPTRADDLCEVKLAGRAGEALPRLVDALAAARRA